MSIGKRLLDLAKSNLLDFRSAFERDEDRELLDRDRPGETSTETAEPAEAADGDDGSIGARAGRRAKRVKDAAEEAWDRAFEAAKARAGVRSDGSGDPAADRRRWYKTLELEPDADTAAVRKAYRRLMKQYHPDRFANDPDKYKAATEFARRLTEAHDGLMAHLGG